MEQAPAHRRVFLSYRSTDHVVVGEFAARLRRDRVDAWYDHWEIAPGDDIVAKMDQGIDSCAAGLIFISHAWLEGSWVHERVHRAGVVQGGGWHPARFGPAGGRRGPLPVRLRKLARRSEADYEAIRDTLLGIDRSPGVTTTLQAHTRSVTVRLKDAGTSRATVSLLEDHQGPPEGEHTNPMKGQGWLRSLRGVAT